MKYKIIYLTALLSAALLFFSKNILAQTPQSANKTAFTNVNVIKMTDDGILQNQTVLIENSRITNILPADDFSPDGSIRIIDGSGKFLIPGLGEMHGHVPPPIQSPNFPETYLEDVLFLYISGGITTVRGMLGHPGQLDLKEAVGNGTMIGPTLYLAGPSFNGNSIHSPEQAAEVVRLQKKEGWDLLKIHPGLTLEEYRAIAETAHEVGITFAGHVPEDVGLVNALELGQKTIDHLDGYTAFMDATNQPVSENKLQEAVDLTLKHNTWVVPTQALWETLIGAADYDKLKQYVELKYMPKQVLSGWYNYIERRIENNPYFSSESGKIHAENRQKLLKALNDAGANILMGTDAPQVFSVPGFSIHREIPVLKDAGMSAYDILVSGTRNVGDYLSDKDNFGTIEEGKRADLILLPGNPLEDLSVLKDLSGVMVRGNWFSREFIDQKLAEIEHRYSD
ncbi:MAG: amidohydrolase family protein [Balneolaceae bacterium]